jgi:hypothetical protein
VNLTDFSGRKVHQNQNWKLTEFNIHVNPIMTLSIAIGTENYLISNVKRNGFLTEFKRDMLRPG